MGRIAIKELEAKKKEGLCKIHNSKCNILKSITKLQIANDKLAENIEAKPSIAFFKPVDKNLLEEYRRFPVVTNYKLGKFQPENIDEMIHEAFGKLRNIEKGTTKVISME